MSKRSLQAQQPSKPSGSKSVELPRSVRPSHLKSSPAPSRNSEATLGSKLHRSQDDNNSTPSSPHTSARESEPATDETSEQTDFGSPSLEIAERQAVAMLDKITKKSERNHQKYNALHDSILGKDKQVDELHASLEAFARQTVGLEALCNSELDSETLDELFMSIPSHQRQLYLAE